MMAESIADAQVALDRSAAELVAELAQTRVPVVPSITETIGADGSISYATAKPQMVSLLELEQLEVDLFRGSQPSTAHTPGIHGILPDGFTRESTGSVPASVVRTLGASELARASERQYMDLLRDFSESASFQRDPALARSLCGTALPLPVAAMASPDTHPAFRAVAARSGWHARSAPIVQPTCC